MGTIILVEGKDDKFVVKQLLVSHQITDIEVIPPNEDDPDSPLGGWNALYQLFPVKLKSMTRDDSIGIILDADNNLTSRWDSFINRVKKLGYQQLPKLPDQNGTIISSQDKMPTVGLWLMPDNTLVGNLEDFVLTMIKKEHKALEKRAVDCVNDIPEEDKLFKDKDKSKACVHTWLAWQKMPGTRMNAAINQHYLDPTCPEAESFINWVKRLAQ